MLEFQAMNAEKKRLGARFPRLALLPALLLALPGAAAAETAFVAGDAAAGGELYASQCQACHGAGGNSLVPEQPIVAGQHAEYLAAQIRAFRDQARVNAAMWPFVENLSDADVADLAAFLAGQQAGLSGAVDQELVLRGEHLYRNGAAAAGVPNCTGCHGPQGEGIPPLYPQLGGQHAAYTAAALAAFRSGERENEVMNEIASGLSDADIAALAEYIAGLY